MRKGSLMHGRAQSAQPPSREHPSALDQPVNGPRCWSESTSAACTSPEDRSAGGMQEVTGSASPEGRRPSRIPKVTGSSPEDRSTTVVRLASPLRPSSAVIAAVEVMVASSVRRSGPIFPTTATTSPEHRSAAGSRPSATGFSPEDRSAAGNKPSATDSSPEDHSAEGVRAGEVQALLLQGIGHFWSQQLWTLHVGWTLEQMTWRSLGFFWVS
jgi:hypothetical protein